jgi:diguanylate cyclase (GGDEF)-like protein/PAS domain S-box-containing protein
VPAPLALLGLAESSEALFHALTDRAPVGIFVTDAEGRCVYCNSFVLGLSGLTLEESLGYGWMRALHPDDVERVQAGWAASAAAGTEFALEYRFRRPDGAVSWVDGIASDVHGPGGTLLGWVGICVDLTERKRGEERLREMFEHARDAVYSSDMRGRFTSVNGATEKLTGYTREELLEMTLVDLIAPEDAERGRALMLRRLAGTHDGITDVQLVRKDGRRVRVEISARRVFDETGPVGVEAIARDVTEQHELQERLEYQAFHDPLTGLPNRALLRDRLEQALVRAARAGTKVAVMLMDVDNFKLVNDTLGHAAGDELLVGIAPRLRLALRQSDTVARLGGDEFAFVLEGVSDERSAVAVAERVLAGFEEPLPTAYGEHRIAASLGIVVADASDDAETLLRNADAAMYTAKAQSKGGYALYEESRRLELVREADVAHALAGAIDTGELEVHYQPIVSLTDGRILAVEALARWNHPEWGWVSPAEFVPAAERNGLIGPLGQLVLGEAARQAAIWRGCSPGSMPFGVFVNVSPRELAVDGFVEHLAGTLDRAGLTTADIGVEVTESALIGEAGSTAARNLDALARLGIRLSLDDFGTGYSALASLKRFPFSVLKVDRFFVGAIADLEQAAPITSAVVALGQTLGMTVVAEGVETPPQLERLRRLGCHAGQGYLLARPQSAAELTDLLARCGGCIPLPRRGAAAA